jgi:peptidoglycan/xylan/chitin deacetylase (PgdA/CDA1 family)
VLVLGVVGVIAARAWPTLTPVTATVAATVTTAPTSPPLATSATVERTATPPAPKPTTASATATSAAATRAPTAAPATAALPAPTPQPAAKPAVSPVANAPAAISDAGKRVSLTFDAGADRGYAEDILDFLLEQRIPASFGMTGQWAKAHPDLVKRMGAEGHHLINHTQTHRSFTGLSDNLAGLSAAQRRAELDQADAVIAPLIGHSTKPWYRLPYGDDDARVAADVAAAGYTRKAGWTLDSWGWRGISASEIVARCLQAAAPNAVYIFHVGAASQDGPALPRIVAGLRERGYGFATMADL